MVTRKVYCSTSNAEKEIDLTPAEFQLLLYLARNPEKDISRKEIESNLASDDTKKRHTRVIDAQIKSLRKKCPKLMHSIISVYGVGYRFIPRS